MSLVWSILLWVLKILGGILGILLIGIGLILFCKTKLEISYRDQTPMLWLRFLFLRIKLYPRKKKTSKKKKDAIPEQKASTDSPSPQEPDVRTEVTQAVKPLRTEPEPTKPKAIKSAEDKAKDTLKHFELSDYIRLLKIITNRFLKKFNCELLILHAEIGSEDAAKTALECGAIHTALYPILGAFSASGHLKKADVQITPDFSSEEIKAEAKTVFSIRLFRTLPGIKELYTQLF